jgi:lipopolysaccharide export system permease protein
MLNNKQLSSAIDSLQLKYEEKKLLFKTNISNKYANKLMLEKIFEDTVLPSKKKDKKQYDIAINKIKILESIAKSNKDDLEYRKIIITKHKIEWHRKISLAVACLLLFLIGAPLGSIIRKGGFGVPVLVAALFFIFYYILNIIGEKSAKDLSMQAYEGMWLANIVFVPIAIFLIYKAKNDAKIFDFTPITLVLKRFKKQDPIA